MKIVRPPVAIGHYKMIKHKGDKGNEQNPRRYLIDKTGTQYIQIVHTHWSLFSKNVIINAVVVYLIKMEIINSLILTNSNEIHYSRAIDRNDSCSHNHFS